MTDELTGVLDRRTWNGIARRALADAREREQPVALIFLDLDRFKRVNDAYGHPAGDEVLRAVAALLRRARRDSLISRYGGYAGDEFLILLPSAHADSALAFARHIQQGIRGLTVSARTASAATATITAQTASIGVAIRRPQDLPAADLAHLLLDSDVALRMAKRNGRDQICLAPSGTGEESR